MILERIKSEGLAHYSYFIGSESYAAVIDPRRDCQVYSDLARKNGQKIIHILETHRNEDYVIGSLELQRLTGAEIYHGAGLPWKYGTAISEGQELRVGKVKLMAVYTPGHTIESTSYTLTDSVSEKVVSVFTGDTLFVNEVGRVDLYGSHEVPRMAGLLYDSIFTKLMPLGDSVIIRPAHGAGSVCGRKIGEREESTLCMERLTSPLLQLSRDEFIQRKVNERLELPPYFTQMEKYNLEGSPLLHGLPRPDMLHPHQFKQRLDKGAVLVDANYPPTFGGAHITGAYNIWLSGLPEFAGWVLPYDIPLLLVLPDEEDADAVVRYLVRLGYDMIDGILYGGIEAWYDAGLTVESLRLMSVQELKTLLDSGDNKVNVLDVRSEDEWNTGHIPGARHIYVGNIPQHLDDIPQDGLLAVICSVGRRGSLGASILQRTGFKNVANVLGGMTAWQADGFYTE